MKDMVVITGNWGPKIRSDCEIKLEVRSGKGIDVNLDSKVKAMYGQSIEDLIREILSFFDISGAGVWINDSGALPFVIAARLEAAVRMIRPDISEYLPEMIPENMYETKRERFRFSRLYLPGNTPSMMLNAGLHSPDGLIFDLEDSVAPARKHEARLLVRNALRQVNSYNSERMVRITQGEMGIEDLSYIVPHNVHVILVPKCESADYIIRLEDRIIQLKREAGIERPVFLMPIIESALGVERAFDIATSSENIVAMAIGLEDYTADLGVQRTAGGYESLYARMRIINACKAAAIQPIDSVFSDVSDMEALSQNVSLSKSLGFEGMGCIHPRQIAVIHRGFAPSDEEIDKARRIVIAFREAENKGLGVVSLGSKMIDPPVVRRAERTISLAVRMDLLPANWDEPESETEN